jgi:hypothetical protein
MAAFAPSAMAASKVTVNYDWRGGTPLDKLSGTRAFPIRGDCTASITLPALKKGTAVLAYWDIYDAGWNKIKSVGAHNYKIYGYRPTNFNLTSISPYVDRMIYAVARWQ